MPDLSFIAFLLLGLLVVVVYSWERFNEPSFNEPSFPNHEALPRTVEPLKYLFLRPAYRRARLAYVGAALSLYGLLALTGLQSIEKLGVRPETFPPQAWVLAVALLLVGVLPNANLKWITVIDEAMRRWVHAWFLVPDGIVRRIGILEDAHYEPPASELDALSNTLRKKVKDGLKCPAGSLHHRWARATMLVESLRRMDAGAVHPLKRVAFAPFQEDFETILEKYRALKRDIEEPGDEAGNEEREQKLISSVNALLKRIYAYISWGIRHQAETEREVDDTLEDLGFRIPVGSYSRLFDVVMPAVVLIAVITLVFWLAIYAITHALGGNAPSFSASVVNALMSAMAASLMYGRAVYIALNRRAAQIEQKDWRQGSPRCLAPIAWRAGLVTWAVIVLSTILWSVPDTLQSIAGLALQAKALLFRSETGVSASTGWAFLPVSMATALPWLLAGATASVLLAQLAGGDVRRTDKPHRWRDAAVLGLGLGIAAAAAQLIQTALVEVLTDEKPPPLEYVPVVGLAGMACGATMGWLVPHAYRANLVTPSEPPIACKLRDLLRRAEAMMGGRTAAENWAFMPNTQLGGITPAEAIRYKGYATGVGRLLEGDAALRRDASRPGPAERPMPVVIEGGLSLDSNAA